MNALKMCLNWKVVAGLAVVGLGVTLLAPGAVVAALPLLVLAACPLSMIVMMGGMGGMGMKGKHGAAESASPSVPPTGATREEHLAELKDRLAQVQHDQEGLAGAIADLERSEPSTPPMPQLQGQR